MEEWKLYFLKLRLCPTNVTPDLTCNFDNFDGLGAFVGAGLECPRTMEASFDRLAAH